MTSDTPAVPTILLVEDDPMLRTLIRRMLEGAGYDLLVAPNGDTALTLARERPGAIDLLLTDVVMPRMNGFELSGHIVSAHPEVSVLFLSGYADESNSVRAGLKTTRHAFLLKPFTQDVLLGKIQEVLASPAD
jgi:CheY-like chemotaxis protein